MNLDFKNKWVLVTGASSGLGEAISVELAKNYHANLILLARRTDRLNLLKGRIANISSSSSSSDVRILPLDLTSEAEINHFFDQLDIPIYAAVINAGMTLLDKHQNISEEQTCNILKLNIDSTILLTNHLVKHYQKTKSDGGILYISSLSSFYPTPFQALYSGTKAFINNFVLALSKELKAERFSFSIYTPGGIKTEMTKNEKFNHLDRFLASPEDCAKMAIRGFQRRRLLFSSFLSLEILFGKLLPTKLKLAIMDKVYRKSFDE